MQNLIEKKKQLGSLFNQKAAHKCINAIQAIQDMSVTRPEDATRRADETTNLAVIENYMGFEYLAALFTVLSDSLGLKVLPSLWSTFYQMLKSDEMHLSMNVYDLKLAFQYGAAGAYGGNYNTYNLERLMHWCYSYISSKQTKIHLSHEASKKEGGNVDLTNINPDIKMIGKSEPTLEEIAEAREKMEAATHKFQQGPYLTLKKYCEDKGINYRTYIDTKIEQWTTEQFEIDEIGVINVSDLIIRELNRINIEEGLIEE